MKGTVASQYKDYERQTDLIGWATAPSTSEGKKDPETFIVIVQDVCSRFLWAGALTTKQPADVLRAFNQIYERANIQLLPDRLTTDVGGEFADVKRCIEADNKTYHTKASLRSLGSSGQC